MQKESFLSEYVGVNDLDAISTAMYKDKKAPSNDFRIIENWFHKNVMILNAKNTIPCISETTVKMMTLYSMEKLPNSCEEKVTMNLNLNHKLEAQKRISSFLDPEKIKFISNAFKKSHFSSCLVIWTFSFRKFNKLGNRVHKKISKYSV